MAGRHSKRRGRPRGSLRSGGLAGQYVALCGMTVLAASLTDPGRGCCRECMR